MYLCAFPGEWMWLDQSVMDFTNWGEGQPIDYSYGRIVSSDGKWKAGSPGYRSYICKTPKGKIILNNNNNYGFNRNDEIRPHNIFDLMPAWVTCSSVMSLHSLTLLKWSIFSNVLSVQTVLSLFKWRCPGSGHLYLQKHCSSLTTPCL